MENILNQLFYGDYSAFRNLSVATNFEKPEQHRRGEISMQLKSQVSEEQFDLIVQLMDSMDQSQTESMEKAFEMGVRLGAQFAMAVCREDSPGQETEVRA